MLRPIIAYKCTKANKLFSIFHLLVFSRTETLQRLSGRNSDIEKDFQSVNKNKPKVFSLQKDTDHAARSLVNDFFQCLLYFELCVRRHVHELIGKPFSHQIRERLSK